jgi:arabinogalactan endo-1,4-beta-galactosidase
METRIPSIVSFFCIIVAAFLLQLAAVNVAHAAEYAIGADLSFLMSAEERGTVFKEDGQAKPGLKIFKDHGYNWIRRRVLLFTVGTSRQYAQRPEIHVAPGEKSQGAWV